MQFKQGPHVGACFYTRVMEEVEIGYYSSGKIEYEWYKKNGKYHGTQKCYYPYGNLFYSCMRINGELHGIYQDFDFNGTMSCMKNFVANNRQGPQITFKYGR